MLHPKYKKSTDIEVLGLPKAFHHGPTQSTQETNIWYSSEYSSRSRSSTELVGQVRYYGATFVR